MTSPQVLDLEGKKSAWKPLLAATGGFVLLLIVAQALRAVIYLALFRLGIGQTDVGGNAISAAAMLLTGLLLLAALRPSAASLGLTGPAVSRPERLLTAAGGALLLVLAAINVALDPKQLASLLHGCLVTPFFEELIFRGWGWGRIEAAMPARWRGRGTLALTVFLFGLWHLGYVDVIGLRMAAHPEHSAPLSLVMGMKVLVGAAVGLLAGLPRLRSRRVYGSMILHALWNLFGK